ncbi:hypothetical protein FJT64_005425 [Amphibalanus amphitrite]|uniref:SWIM-type domain-containing protein n=1 Tax=Amphibalanus amphitrite TaxID=1232801 RepID=A0A6A4VR40_AMPAM|nr:hypothetical protein FJT64_005425 [Amphibalanus amphitrite]
MSALLMSRPGAQLIYKAWFRCQRNVPGAAVAASGPDGRHTACPAALAISVCSAQVSQRTDPHLPASPGCVRLRHVHNHPVRCAADLRFRGVSTAARDALEALLARGYAPSAARRALQHQLQLHLGECYPLAAADRAVLPTLKDVCRIYYQRYGTPAQRRATAQRSVALEQSGDASGATVEDEVADNPDKASGGRKSVMRDERGVIEPATTCESTDAARLQVELVDGDILTFDSLGTDSEYSVLEQEGSASRMDSEDQVLESGGESITVDRLEDAELVVERSADLILGSTDDTTLELELVRSESPAARRTDHQTLNPEGADPGAEELPSLESLLAGSMVPDPGAISARLRELVTEYGTKMATGGGAAAFARLDGYGFAAALTTPLMRRVHLHLPQSGELVFVDSPGRSERHGCCLWLLVCASEAGALPLGLLLASSESGGALRAALQLWLRTLPPGAFAGRGADGPQVVITDDGAGQRAALAARFPAALAVLCSFRLLQAVWRWLWQVRGRVSAEDRARLLLLTRRLLCAGSVAQLERRFREASADPIMARHADFLKQFTSIYRHRHLWAVWYGEEEASDADGRAAARTASLFDLAASLLRDRLLFMAAEYGPAEAFDFWTRHGDAYFVERISRALSGGGPPSGHARYVPPPPGSELRARRAGPHSHEVTDGEAVFQLDLELGCCTCRPGRSGAPCAHQSAAARLERRPPVAPVAAEAAAVLRQLATDMPLLEPGPAPLPAGWLQAVTAAAGLPSVEVIVSTEQPPDLQPRSPADERTTDWEQRDTEGGLLAADTGSLQMEGGGVTDSADSGECQRNPTITDIDNSMEDSSAQTAVSAGLSEDTAGAGADSPVDPAEEAMSAAIVALQEVTADLTGRLAADPERYVPLVRDLVSRYWRLEGADGLRSVTDRLTGLGGDPGGPAPGDA